MSEQSSVVGDAMTSLNRHLETVQPKSGQPSNIAGAMQVKTQYTTAVQVVKPRNLQEVKRRCLEEAALMGEECYYSWKQGGKIIEGATVQAMLMAARNWGNSVVETRVDYSDPDAFTYYSAFIDLETGFNNVRPYRQRREAPKKKSGEQIYSDGRGEDVMFQIGTSKSARNAVRDALPSWLKDAIMAVGKDNVTAKIEKMGVEKAKTMIKTKAESLGIAFERIESEYGRERAWKTAELVMISSALRQIEDGFEKDTDIFPVKVGTEAPTGSEQPKPETPKEPQPSAAEPEAPAPVASQPSGTELPPDYDKAEVGRLITLIDNSKTDADVMQVYNQQIQKARDEGRITGVHYQELTQRMKDKAKSFKKQK